MWPDTSGYARDQWGYRIAESPISQEWGKEWNMCIYI